MSDKIRINSIELNNYRQYYGKHKIDFSSREEGFTIIAGKNGEGKSNLLNSISWCLYHIEPHGMRNSLGHDENKSLPVINNRYITELDEETLGETSVKIWMEKGDTIYSISRVLSVLKHKLEFKKLDNGQEILLIAQEAEDKVPQGCEILPENSGFVIKEKGLGDVDFKDTRDKSEPETLMEEILPKGLSKYFLLDGEFLEDFWENSNTVQNGIEQISQLHLLSSLGRHVTDMCILPKVADREIDSWTTRINNIIWYEKSCDEHGNEKFSQEPRFNPNDEDEDVYYHASGKPRHKEMLDDQKKMQQKMHEITKKISIGSSQNMKYLKETKAELEVNIEKDEKELNDVQGTYRYNLISKSPYVFLKKAIETSVNIIETRTKAGDLPIRQRRQFAEDLLTRGTCICGESLDSIGDDSTKARIDKITQYKDVTLGKDDLDSAVDMKFNFKHDFINNYTDFLKNNFGDPQSNVAKMSDKIDSMRHKLQSINLEIKNYGGEDAARLIDNQQYLADEMKKKIEDAKDIEYQLKENSKIHSDLSIQLNKKKIKNTKIQKLQHAYKIWTQIQDHIQKAYDELKDEIRVNIQNSTWKNFKELLTNPSEFNNFMIESDYSVYLIDAHNTNKIKDLSPGQSLILTLAFVAALREPTGYRFPLVIDSPLGKIDGGNRYNIGMRLPEYLPDEQLTLLVTDTEYVANLPVDSDYPNIPLTCVAKLLDDKISLKHFKIKKEQKGENTGNSCFLQAKLKFDETSKRWMVNTDV